MRNKINPEVINAWAWAGWAGKVHLPKDLKDMRKRGHIAGGLLLMPEIDALPVPISVFEDD